MKTMKEKNAELEEKLLKANTENYRLYNELCKVETELKNVTEEKKVLLSVVDNFAKALANVGKE